MTISTVGVGVAVTPTVLKTYITHYTNRKPRRHKPTAHISYDEGLHLIRTFLKYASHHTVEDLQAFTAQWVPTPSWVRTETVAIPAEYTSRAANAVIGQLGEAGVQTVGGSQWWQWRPKDMALKADWIEMRAHYNEQKRKGEKSRRIMLYVHGGAYFFGSVDEHRYQMQRHARKLQARVFAPRYRLAPQFPFPCGLQDCLAAYLYLLTLHEAEEIILAGESAGGGMVVSVMCLLRDQGLPLPAGAILISPWVDLTHSFPSLAGSDELDYIPSHGFMHKPSMSWPPPNDEELSVISALAKGQDVSTDIARAAAAAEQHAGYSEHNLTDLPQGNGEDSAEVPKPSVPVKGNGEVRPTTPHYLSVELDGKRITLKDQIQMYTTNQLLAHPLVSPVLQPSLGGLPPVMILTGGGELLRDEQIYLAHKMANPSGYPLGSEYRSRYDPEDVILRKYRPTPVQLQVWDDLCHVATTLSFTRPAKSMYRSIAQFGAWALARAQRRAIEIMDDDNISIISSESDSDRQTDTETGSSGDDSKKMASDPTKITGSVGRAGDPLPPFVGNMIRQRVDRHGKTYPLADVHNLPALQLAPDEVGVVKPGPVRKWLAARKRWDTKYTSASIKVRKERIRALATKEIRGFGTDERPPPSALAARRTDKDLLPKRKGKSFGLAMWSNWGSKHDESTIRREEEAVMAERTEENAKNTGDIDGAQVPGPSMDGEVKPSPAADSPTSRHSRLPSISISRSRSPSRKRRPSGSKVRGRTRTVSVTDTGQTEGTQTPLPHFRPQAVSSTTIQETSTMESGKSLASTARPLSQESQSQTPDSALLSAGFLPKFKTASHLRDDSGGPALSDAASNRTSRSGLASDNASTRAVFAAPGISKNVDEDQPRHEPKALTPASTVTSRPTSPLINESKVTESYGEELQAGGASVGERSEQGTTIEISAPAISVSTHNGEQGYNATLSPTPGHVGSDTPRSQRSLERLQSHQHDEGMGRMQPLRSLSSTAVVRADGVVGVVDDGAESTFANGDSAEGEEGAKSKMTDHATNATVNHVDGGVDADGTHANEKSVLPAGNKGRARPQLYDRTETTFQTAAEKLSE